MKKILSILFLILLFNTQEIFAQNDPAYDSIAALNLDYYASRPVDSLLQMLPQSYKSINLIGSTKSNKIKGLSIFYSSGMEVWIAPRNYIHMAATDPNRIWDLTLFKKEIASYISVMHPEFNSRWGHHP